MAYFIDGLGNLLFDIKVQVLKGDKCIHYLEGKCGDKITIILNELNKVKNSLGDNVKYTLTWSWQAEDQDYDSLIEFLRGPIDTLT
jgi:hypothetical protein